jgi:NAD-dependent DNA ligase
VTIRVLAELGGQQAEDAVARLREQIERANKAYYVQDAPEISDAEYDRLFRELQALDLLAEKRIVFDAGQVKERLARIVNDDD